MNNREDLQAITKFRKSFNKSSLTTRNIKRNIEMYFIVFPTLLYFVIFCYGPMYGVQIAFKDFLPSKGILGSEWVGFKHFVKFFNGPYFWVLIRNTFIISIYSIAVGFPLPIILAVMLNYQKNMVFKKIVQTTSYAPHFISIVVVVSMLKLFASPTNGIINVIIKMSGGSAINFMAIPEYFRSIYVWSGIWQDIGWGAIIYIGALSMVSPELHEAAIVDGASVLKRIWHVDIPGIFPTMSIMFILSMGSILAVGFEKIYLMQNDLNASVSEVIATYVYKVGLIQTQYSFTSAVGLFNSLINFIILIIVNFLFRRTGKTSLF